MKINTLKLNDKNPRQIKGERLATLKKSIQDFEKMLELRPIIADENNVVLGGNMRLQALKALGYKDIPDKWVLKASDLTEEQKKEFIIKDNIGFGEWDFDILANEFDYEKLTEWGFDEFTDNLSPDGLSDEFSLPDGDKAPFQQMTFTLADEQAEILKEKLTAIKQTDIYKFCETYGNENSNGNALFALINQ